MEPKIKRVEYEWGEGNNLKLNNSDAIKEQCGFAKFAVFMAIFSITVATSLFIFISLMPYQIIFVGIAVALMMALISTKDITEYLLIGYSFVYWISPDGVLQKRLIKNNKYTCSYLYSLIGEHLYFKVCGKKGHTYYCPKNAAPHLINQIDSGYGNCTKIILHDEDRDVNEDWIEICLLDTLSYPIKILNIFQLALPFNGHIFYEMQFRFAELEKKKNESDQLNALVESMIEFLNNSSRVGRGDEATKLLVSAYNRLVAIDATNIKKYSLHFYSFTLTDDDPLQRNSFYCHNDRAAKSWVSLLATERFKDNPLIQRVKINLTRIPEQKTEAETKISFVHQLPRRAVAAPVTEQPTTPTV